MLESTQYKQENRNKLYQPPPKQDYSRNFSKLLIVIIISFVFIAGQFIGGYISKSISVISDAFHLVTDLIGFIISYAFIYYSRKKPNHKMSFGYHRMQVLGALANLYIIWALAFFLIYEATNRIINKRWVQNPKIMLIVAAAGLPVNIIMFFVLHSGNSHSHGLMSQKCGEHNQLEDNKQDDSVIQMCECLGVCCDNVQCLAMQKYEDHCHVKQGALQKIHRHGRKVSFQDNKIIRNFQENNKNQIEIQNNETLKEPGNIKEKLNKYNNQNIQNHSHQDHNHEHHHNHENMSMKAAVLHALSDVIQSIGLLISSLVIFFLGSNMGQNVSQWNNWHYFDPISTYIFSIIVIISTIPIAKNCYQVIMQSTPNGMSVTQLKKDLQGIPAVLQVHNIHLWDLRPGKTVLIAHVASEKNQERNVLRRVTDYCRKKRIYHSTIQVQEFELMNNQEYIQCQHGFH